MKSKLYDYYQSQEDSAYAEKRKTQVGSGDRSEKIRTYNYPQNRVTDHRIGFTIQQLDRVMEGKLDSIIEALITFEQKRLLSAEGAE